ncbi:cellulase family glycosylhydrolase [uncultured Alistipes sp.]|uniref:glycoside hydrolase family 5 protein n=1 Tax=uncultured Alistipes sp. TaxID=538949 RepID=UPI0025EC2AEC|nr:cellulase family glycosylhydrolase [uncultured Alistipes sp.]
MNRIIIFLLAVFVTADAWAKRPELPDASYDNLPRWRGFNLLEKFQHQPDGFSQTAPVWSFYNEPFKEEDFQIIADLGFNFVRLPMSYKCWVKGDNLLDFDEKTLKEIDQAVKWGKKYKIHVCICMHRAPGFGVCAVGPAEEYNLWEDEYIQDIFAAHWAMFAKRYKGIPNSHLSFNLVNEPLWCSVEQYVKAAGKAIRAIRAIDPDRLIISDALNYGYSPIDALDSLKVAQSGRGYAPGYLTHYKASWNEAGSATVPPTWPYVEPNGKVWDKKAFEEMYKLFVDFRENHATGVHIGECGVYKYTPHAVVLDFFRDLTSTLKEYDIGWALWQLRGVNGILDSERDDVIYEPYRGHKLDRKLLEILQAN